MQPTSVLKNILFKELEKLFITSQKGSKIFYIPTLGTPWTLFYCWVAHGKRQSSNTLLCGWQWLPWGWKYPSLSKG
jgi:hypothetical protein